MSFLIAYLIRISTISFQMASSSLKNALSYFKPYINYIKHYDYNNKNYQIFLKYKNYSRLKKNSIYL